MPRVQNRLERYAELLRGSPHNLLSPQGLRELEVRHFPESVAFAQQLPGLAPLLDVGTGGGLPGMVIAIVRPELEVHLLEATGKKVTFLREVAAELELAVTVHHGRAEDLGRGPLRGAFGIVTARAVARLDKLVEWCAPFLQQGGQLHAIKGARWREELEEAQSVLTRRHLGVVSTPDHQPAGLEAGADPLRPQVLVLVRKD